MLSNSEKLQGYPLSMIPTAGIRLRCGDAMGYVASIGRFDLACDLPRQLAKIRLAFLLKCLDAFA